MGYLLFSISTTLEAKREEIPIPMDCRIPGFSWTAWAAGAPVFTTTEGFGPSPTDTGGILEFWFHWNSTSRKSQRPTASLAFLKASARLHLPPSLEQTSSSSQRRFWRSSRAL